MKMHYTMTDFEGRVTSSKPCCGFLITVGLWSHCWQVYVVLIRTTMQITKYKPIEFDDKWNLLLSDVPESDIDGDLDPSEVNSSTNFVNEQDGNEMSIVMTTCRQKCNQD